MILPPFFGIASPYDEDSVKQVILTYLSKDVLTFKDPKPTASVTYLAKDVVTYQVFDPVVSLTFLSLDTVSLPKLKESANITYQSFDVCTYDPPPALPEKAFFLSSEAEDSSVTLSWNSPYNNRCNITEYILEYYNCFVSKFLTENNDSITDENNNILIGENYKQKCYYQKYDYSRILAENDDRLYDDSFLVTENSRNIGIVNNINVDNLLNNQPYIFRIAAVNCVGTGEFGYSDIITPIGPRPFNYCDIKLFMKPDSTNDLQQSLIDQSCTIKNIDALEGVSVSSESAFGLGSLYFDGQYSNFPTPATYSHLIVNKGIDNWSLNGDFTIEMWIKPDNSYASSNQTLISAYTQNEYGYGDNNNYWKLYRYQNTIRFIAQIDEYLNYDPYFIYGYVQLVSPNLSLSTVDFTHISVSRFQNNVRLYVNGILQDKEFFDQNVNIISDNLVVGANQTSTYDSSDTFGIGRGAVNQPYIGHIDDIIVSKSARYAKNFIPSQYTENRDCYKC